MEACCDISLLFPGGRKPKFSDFYKKKLAFIVAMVVVCDIDSKPLVASHVRLNTSGPTLDPPFQALGLLKLLH